MPRCLSPLACVLVIAGCAVTGPGGAPPSPPVAIAAPTPDEFCPTTPPPSIVPADIAADRVTGTWIATSSEPRPEWNPPTFCDRRAFQLRLFQVGTAVTGEVSAVDGYPYLFDTSMLGPGRVEGTLTDGRLVLSGTATGFYASPDPHVDYDLTYDAAHRWFVGRINGKAVWLLPLAAQDPCPTPRPCDPVA